MKRWVSLACLSLMGVSLPAVAQQANQNINVLPVSDAESADAELTGDLYLQRQVEPTIAVSTRNPDHLIAFFNDYRAVDIPDDEGLGETQNVAEKKGALDRFLAWFRGRPEPAVESEMPAQAAASEAWVGGSRSYDGGLTWSGFFVPGAPFDDLVQATLDSPVFGLEAATDPVAAAAPCGRVEVVWLGFTRGGQSKMVVSTYEDLNNDEGGDTWQYLRTTVLETGNNALNGYFLDKPFLTVDPHRQEGAGCGYNVYASYTTFNGQESDGKFRSKVTFARSIDSGATYSTQKLNAPFHQNQGTWIAVDPRAGTPNTTGGGTIHLFWRHFFGPDTILTIDSSDYGRRFPGNPKKMTGNEDIAAFDQPSLGIGTIANPVTDLTFRSNGFPTATVTSEGVVLVAWQEKVDIAPGSPTFGQPDLLGSPRIVMMRSTNGGSSWEGFDKFGADAPRQAIDFGDRDQPGDPSIPPDGFGAIPLARPSGPQVMPALSCGGGRCMLTYYESRGLLGPADTINAGVDLSPTTGFISGLDRLLDLRATLLDPLTGRRESTTQVSRYPIGVAADFNNDPDPPGERLDDVDEVCSPAPALTGGVLCRRRVNAFGKPQSAAGTTPFGGDYTFLSPILPLVPDITDEAPGDWRWTTEATDVPYRSFRAIWADNRNLAPPTLPDDVEEAYRYSAYGPPGLGGACVNAGSRNTDVLTARIDAELIVTAPTTYKQLNARRSFPLSVSNGTDQTKHYHLAITMGAGDASFALDEDLDVDSGDVEIFRYSSIAQVVYVNAGAAGPIQVTVTETGNCSDSGTPPCQTGAVTFNPDPNNPPLQDLGMVETQDPFVINPFVINPFVINGSLSNPFVINPFVINPFVINTTPGDPNYQEVYGIVDTTWTVTADETSTASSYLSLINIDNAEQYFDDYIFQLITYRTSGNGGFGTSGDPCASYNIPQDQIISSVYNDPANPFVINPFVINPFVINPFVINPFVINSTFTMAPSDGATAGPTPDTRTPELDDGTTKAPRRPDAVNVTLRAIQVSDNPQPEFRPQVDKPSHSVLSLSCDPAETPNCVYSTSPDLLPVLGEDPLATGTVTVGQTLVFPANGWTLENQGRTDATADETSTLRHGFYLSSFNPEGWLEANPGKTTADMIAEPGFRSLGVFETSETNTLVAYGTETFPTGSSLTIPTDLGGGEYYLVLFVDDLLEVSENNEINNFELASFSIIVEVNTAPVAVDDSFTIDEDLPYSGSLAANDGEGDDLTFTLVEPFATAGEVALDTDTGDFTYTPNPDINGGDSFAFIASDDEFDSNLGTVSVTISAVNDAPVATGGQTFDVPEDGMLIDALEAADADAGDVLTFAVVPGSGPIHGILVLNPDGSFVYTPDPDFAGTDTFEFTVCDQNDVCSTLSALVAVSVQASADAPVLASIGGRSVDEGVSASIGLSATDPDVGDTLTLTTSGVPGFCSFAPTGPGTATIDCAPDFTQSGTYSITVTVSDGGSSPLTDSETFVLTVNEVNRAPVLASIGAQSVDEGVSLGISLSATDPDFGDDLTLGVAGLPSFCTFTSASSGEGSISCSPGFTDAGSFPLTVTVTDNGVPNLTGSESFSLAVNNVNQAPDLDPITAQSVNEGVSSSIDLTASDPDAESVLTFSTSGLPTFCVLTDSSGPNGSIDCSPDFASSGSYSFTVTVTDNGSPESADSQVVSLTVGEVNRAPVLATIGSQSVNEGGSLVISLSATDLDASDVLSLGVAGLPAFCTFSAPEPGIGFISCSPGFDDHATYTVTVTVADTGEPNLTDSETFSLIVNNTNRPPVVIADAVDVNQNGSVIFDPVLNTLGVAIGLDYDADGDVIFLTGVTIDNPLSGGTVSRVGNEVTYVPGLNFVGTDTLTYGISDGSAGSTGTITVTVQDGVPDWGFLGLRSPWKVRPIPRVNRGSAFPVNWQYADPSTGQPVESADSIPEVRVWGPYDNCGSVGAPTELEQVLFPGNSDYHYSDGSLVHQLNWDTDNTVKGACYWIRVYSGKTGQIDDRTDDGDLFVVRIK